MAITLGVGPVYTTSAGTTTISVTLNGVTQGRAVLVCVQWGPEKTLNVTSVAISGETNATIKAKESGTANMGQVWAIFPQIAGANGNKTITATFSGTVTTPGIWAQELVGIAVPLVTSTDTQFTRTTGQFDSTINVDYTASVDNAAVFMSWCAGTNPASLAAAWVEPPVMLLNSRSTWFGGVYDYDGGFYALDDGTAGSHSYTRDIGATSSTIGLNVFGIGPIAVPVPPPNNPTAVRSPTAVLGASNF